MVMKLKMIRTYSSTVLVLCSVLQCTVIATSCLVLQVDSAALMTHCSRFEKRCDMLSRRHLL